MESRVVDSLPNLEIEIEAKFEMEDGYVVYGICDEWNFCVLITDSFKIDRKPYERF